MTFWIVLAIIAKWIWVPIVILALIFHNWVSATIMVPLVSNFWGLLLVSLALVVLVMNFVYWIKRMVSGGQSRR